MTRQQETFRALMNNYDEVIRLTGVAADSTGSASARMEVYLDSVEAKTNQLKATWEEFIMSLGQSDSYKNLLDFLQWVLKHMPLVIGMITSVIILFKGKTILKALTEIHLKTGELSKSLSILKTGFYTNSEGMRTAATSAQVLEASLSMLSLAISAVTMAITIGIQAYQSWKQANVEAAEKAKEEASAHEQKAKAIDDAIAKYTEIYNSTEEYSKKQEELKNLSQELTEAYGEEANALDLLNGKYEDNVAKMEEKANRERQENLANLKSAADRGESNLNNWVNWAIPRTNRCFL